MTDHGDAIGVGDGERAVVLEEDDRLSGRGAGELAVRLACAHARGVVAVGHLDELIEDAERRAVDDLRGDAAIVHGGGELVVEDEAERHLEIEPRVHAAGRVAHSEAEVADDEAVEAPAIAEHVREQLAAVAAPVAVDCIVRAHHDRRAGVDAHLEMREVHLVQYARRHRHVDVEAHVLHRVGGEVFHAGHGVALDALHERASHRADVHRVFTVGFLGAAPCGVAQQVDTDASEEVAPERAQLFADGVADAFFKRGVEGGAAGH